MIPHRTQLSRSSALPVYPHPLHGKGGVGVVVPEPIAIDRLDVLVEDDLLWHICDEDAASRLLGIRRGLVAVEKELELVVMPLGREGVPALPEARQLRTQGRVQRTEALPLTFHSMSVLSGLYLFRQSLLFLAQWYEAVAAGKAGFVLYSIISISPPPGQQPLCAHVQNAGQMPTYLRAGSEQFAASQNEHEASGTAANSFVSIHPEVWFRYVPSWHRYRGFLVVCNLSCPSEASTSSGT